MMNTQLMVVPVFLWAGMIFGISFLESWVKFRAPHLNRAVGLEVGQTVFSYFHRVQWVWLFIIFILVELTSFPLKYALLLSVLIIILSIQHFYIFPILKKRVSIILKGENLQTSFVHTLYGIFEVLKFLILMGFGIVFL